MSETPPATPLTRIKSNIHAFYKLSQLEQNTQKQHNLTQRYIPVYQKHDCGYSTIKIGSSNQHNNNDLHVDFDSVSNGKRKCVNSRTCPPSAVNS